MHILMITSEWPSPSYPNAVPFIVRQVETLRKNGIQVTVFPFRGNKRIGNYVQARRAVQNLIKHNEFDLVHAQWGQSVLLALPKKMPLVVTFRGDDVYGIVGRKTHQTIPGLILRLISHYSARIADERIVVARDLASSLGMRDFHVIPSGIDLNRFYPMEKQQARRSLGLPDKDLVLFVGNPSNPVKRLPLIREAVALAQASNANIELICLGNAPHDQVPLYMNASDVLILASVHEGSPNVVKEALACNLPVVSTNVGDVGERIGLIEGCVVCADDQTQTIAAALSEVLKFRKRINGRDTVIHLDEECMIHKLISVYQAVLKRN